MKISMKPSGIQGGWLNHVLQSGCKATWRPAAFGRTEWLIKKDGEAIRICQGKNTVLATKINNPTEKQREIAKTLAAAGIAVLSNE